LHEELQLDLSVRDPTDRVLANSGPIRSLSHSQQALSESPTGVSVYHDHPDWLVEALLREPGHREQILGTVVIAFTPPFHEGPGWRPVVNTALVLLIAAILTRPLARRIVRPLEALTDAARRLGAGDMKARVATPARSAWRWRHGADPADEMQTLTVSFNDMAQRIEGLIASHKDLLANVSHELRSPLARIRVALELIPRSAAVEKPWQGIETDLAELESLIDKVLTTSRLDSPGSRLQLSEIDCRELFARIVEQAARDPQTAGQALHATADAGVLLIADEELLKRALWNLVENAAKYGAPPIVLEARAVGDAVELSVTDRGPGIPESARERVFEAFYRLDAARTPASGEARRSGVGLGLALARRIVAAHRGAIHIEAASLASGGEAGCRVRIVIPRSAP
jgi:signal transduction histidine kinase